MKSILILLFALPVLASSGQPLSENLLLYYPFNGNALDSSGNQFNGLTNGTYCPDHNGTPGKAISFNGFDQYLDFPAKRPELKPELPVSFAYWVMFEDIYVTKTYVFDTDFDQNNHSGLWMNIDPDRHLVVSFGEAMDSTTIYNRQSAVGSKVLEPLTWYFIIAIVRGPNDMEIYINCAQEEVYYEGYGEGLGYTDCLGTMGRIDGSAGVSPYYFKGSIDDFRFWDKALSQPDIDSLCQLVQLSDLQTGKDIDISLYPNPVSNSLSIINAPESVVYMQLTDIQGKQIEMMYYRENVDVSNLLPGNYLLKFEDKNHHSLKVLKFIKI